MAESLISCSFACSVLQSQKDTERGCLVSSDAILEAIKVSISKPILLTTCL